MAETGSTILGHFPVLFEGETLYSAYARLAQRFQLPDFAFRKLLFTKPHVLSTAMISLPYDLGKLVSILPRGCNYSLEYLVAKHTLAGYFRPFLPLSQFDDLLAEMQSARGIGRRSTLINNYIRHPYMQYCLLCAREDRALHGCTFWHLEHQAPGVLVCRQHRIWLEQTSIPIKSTTHASGYYFYDADAYISLALPRFLNLDDKLDRVLLHVAEETHWLLKQQRPSEHATLKERYIPLLAERRFATQNQKIFTHRLVDAFKDAYPPQYLELLGIPIDENVSRNWVATLVQRTHFSSKGTTNPLRNILLIHLLGRSLETFFELPPKRLPFGPGPWPCLNPACPSHEENVITEAIIVYNKNTGEPNATFKCVCGFTYIRYSSIAGRIQDTRPRRTMGKDVFRDVDEPNLFLGRLEEDTWMYSNRG